MTFVISKDGERLMPTSNVKKVRKLMRSGRAEIYKHFPFTIRLLYSTTNGVQDIELTETSPTVFIIFYTVVFIEWFVTFFFGMVVMLYGCRL